MTGGEGIKKRIFVVGCPRSGTTLLQSLLASHSSAYSVPETHFFSRLVGAYLPRVYSLKPKTLMESLRWKMGQLRIGMGLSQRESFLNNKDFLNLFEDSKQGQIVDKYGYFIRQDGRLFFDSLDTLTTQRGKKIWVEKTPDHLFYLDIIERFRKRYDFSVIHLVRNGLHTVSSFYSLEKEFPKTWGRCKLSLREVIRFWIHSIQTSRAWAAKPNHHLVFYSDLVKDPAGTIKKICAAIGIDYETEMLEKYKTSAGQVTSESQMNTYHSNLKKEIDPHESPEHVKNLSAEEYAMIQEELKGYEDLRGLF